MDVKTGVGKSLVMEQNTGIPSNCMRAPARQKTTDEVVVHIYGEAWGRQNTFWENSGTEGEKLRRESYSRIPPWREKKLNKILKREETRGQVDSNLVSKKTAVKDLARTTKKMTYAMAQ